MNGGDASFYVEAQMDKAWSKHHWTRQAWMRRQRD